ncbi:tautomerase family protein [Knoellia sp. S7-12]|uniref:tautomerase family protein n=1 Tax=Knoellia sp. S7-12 TaxID=3126698 RepID=UPI003367D114
MPLVRIDVQAGRTPAALRLMADTVQEVMLDVFAAPAGDRYQIITEHPVGHIIAEDTGLGFERSADVTVIQIFQQGRSDEQKRAAYRELASRLQSRCGLAPTDLIISVVANGPQDWSFGLGRAQFLEGDLQSGGPALHD